MGGDSQLCCVRMYDSRAFSVACLCFSLSLSLSPSPPLSRSLVLSRLHYCIHRSRYPSSSLHSLCVLQLSCKTAQRAARHWWQLLADSKGSITRQTHTRAPSGLEGGTEGGTEGGRERASEAGRQEQARACRDFERPPLYSAAEHFSPTHESVSALQISLE